MKAPGLNKITYEHIIFGGELATQVVVKLFNEIVIQGSVTQGKSISRSVFVLQDLLKLRNLFQYSAISGVGGTSALTVALQLSNN